MNPAALKVNLGDLKRNGILIVNTDEFGTRNLKKAGYAKNPLDDGSLAATGCSRSTRRRSPSARSSELRSTPSRRTAARTSSRSACATGSTTAARADDRAGSTKKFGARPELAEANILACSRPAGLRRHHRGSSRCATRSSRRSSRPAPTATSRATPRSPRAGGRQPQESGLPLFLGAYPITPASDVLHELAMFKQFGVTTFQAEDEIAAVCAAIGASFGGALGVTSTSGPGLALKARRWPGGDDRAAAGRRRHPARRPVDRPADEDRAGRPAQALFGRNGEAPVPVLAAASPSDCFDIASRPAASRSVHDAGDPALRRLPRQRLRALAAARRGRAARLPGALPHRPEGFAPTCATRRRWRAPGRSPARRGSSTGSAASRSRTAPATSPTTR
jgi:2-oxoglutarate/2-oxoacid ferredoxin oxidoreductase subunit alpha